MLSVQPEITVIVLCCLTVGFLLMLHGINGMFIRLDADITKLEALKDETAQLIKETDRVKESGETPKKSRGRPRKNNEEFFVF